MIKIGEFSKIAKTTIKTLRYYDDIGLFKPSFVDENGYRYYELYQLKDLLKIIEYRSFDLPIESILDILKGKDERKIIEDHIKYLESERKKKTLQITSLKIKLKGEKEMNFESKIKLIEEKKVYYRHGVISSINNLFSFVLESGERCGKLNPKLKCKDYCYITYTANEYKENDVELEYAEEVETMGIEGNEVKFRIDPSIKALCVEVVGNYSNLAKGYEYGLNLLKENNYEQAGPIREVYVKGCWNEENEENYLTEIQIPIK